LAAISNPRSVEAAANRVVAHTREILYTTAANQHNRVLLQVVAFTTDIRGNFIAVNKTYTAHFTQGRVRLLRRRGVNASTNAALLWRTLKSRYVALRNLALAWLAD
jgi:hypothetical protein